MNIPGQGRDGDRARAIRTGGRRSLVAVLAVHALLATFTARAAADDGVDASSGASALTDADGSPRDLTHRAIGDCPEMPDEGGIVGSGREYFASSRFFAMGGEAYGAPGHATCVLREWPDGLRHIEVRATTRSFFEVEPPPPPEPRPRRVVPPWDAPELAGLMSIIRPAATLLMGLHPDIAPLVSYE